ncbi:MAG: ABC transporter ATP-binding protein [Actinomycetota bacterium]|nr:ABC transporter ATP-binding protein [Actinomycetota bacterium]
MDQPRQGDGARRLHVPVSAPVPAPTKPSWVRRLGAVVLAKRLSVALALGTAVVGMLAGVVVPLVERDIIDRVMVAHKASAGPYVALIVAIAIASFGLSFLRRYFGGRLAFDVQHDLRERIFSHLQRLDFARHDELQTGQLVSRANSDIGLVQGLLSFLPLMTGNLVMLAVSLVVMYILSPVLALVETLALPLLVVVSISLRSRVFPASYDAQQKEGEVVTVAEESISGVRVVKGFGREGAQIHRLASAALDLFQARVRLIKLQAGLSSTLSAIPGIVQALVLLIGGYLALHGHLTIGTFLVFFSYITQMQAPVRQLSMLIAFSQQARAGAERIFELLDANPLVTDPADPLTDFPSGDVAFRDVDFAYQPGRKVLDGLELVVEAGKVTAVVGRSGSGKSTLALLLPRFYDVSGGAVTIGGVDIRRLKLSDLRRRIGVVFEESFLFSDTIAANISYGKPGASREEIVRAAEMAGAKEFIESLPEGYETTVGEAGITLSGGQRQRVALARALISEPEILVLDDATSAVDAVTESAIHESIKRFARDRTVLLIAHRRSTLELADTVVVLEEGKVAAQGTQEELAETSPVFRALMDSEGDALAEEAEGLEMVPAAPAQARPIAPAPMAMTRRGGGGGGGMGGPMGAALSATPKLLEALERLPEEHRLPEVDEVAVTAPAQSFSFARFLRPFRRGLLLGLALLAADTVLSLAGPSLVRTGIDRGVGAKVSMVIVLASAAYLLVALADWLVVWAQSRVTGITAERALYALRLRIFSHLAHLGMDYYESEMSGRILTRMTTDPDALSNLLQTGITNAFVNVLSFVGVAGVMLFANAELTLAALWVLVPLAFATVWFQRSSQRAYRLARERVAAVNANLAEGLSGVRVTQAFRRESRNTQKFSALSRGYRDARVRAQRLVAIYFPFVLFLSDVASASVLGVGAGLVAGNQIKVGAVIAFTLYIDQLFSPIQQLSQTFDQWQQAQVAIGQVGKLMRTPVSTPVDESPVDPGRITGRIRFQGVSFAYAPEAPTALDGFDFEFRPGESVALVGETGAGKTTVVKLLARFYDPTAGAVLVDGVDLRRLDLDAYRRQVAYVPQEPFLFSASVAENIAFSSDDATSAEIEAASRAVGAHDFISRLPGGYGYQVSERGRALSAGQRQLIALARAYLASPALLLLDEATANLDLATERKVAEAMRVVAGGRTSVMVAHRLPSAAMADRIVVMRHGRITEVGSHEELLEAGGLYSRMWESFGTAASSVA